MKASQSLSRLNDQLNRHMKMILRCTAPFPTGPLLLATPPESRYPYVYPRDASCAIQVFRRLAISPYGYDCAGTAFELMESMVSFLKDVISDEGHWVSATGKLEKNAWSATPKPRKGDTSSLRYP